VPLRMIDCGNPVADHPLNRGLVAWYYGLPNNSGGTVLFDLLGRYPLPNGGTTKPSWDGDRGFGAAARFNGLNHFEAVAAPVSDAPLSMSAWFFSTLSDLNPIVGLCTATVADPSRYRLMAGSSAVPCRAYSTDAASTHAFAESTPNTGYAIRAWAMATGVWVSGSSRAAYLNGGNKGTDATALTLGAPARTLVGRANNSGAVYDPGFTGLVADVSIWNRALSDSEVAAVYVEGRAGNPNRLRRYTPSVWSFGGTAPATSSSNLLLLGCG
jgi:hypothetical protein